MLTKCIRKSMSTRIPAHKETCPFFLNDSMLILYNKWPEVTICFTLFYEPFLIFRNIFHCRWVCLFSVLFAPKPPAYLPFPQWPLILLNPYFSLTLFSRFWPLHIIQPGKDIKFKVRNYSPLSKFKFLHIVFPSERGQPFQESWCNE